MTDTTVAICRLFTVARNPSETPLAELRRGDLDTVKRAARLYGEQVAV
jgi:hypothetical protein